MDENKISKEIPNKFENAIVPDSPKVEDIFNETVVDKMPKEEIIEMQTLMNTNQEEKDSSVDVIYKNDKKLSDILFGSIENQPSGKLDENVVKKEDDVDIKSLEESVNELDKIMQKLNSYNSSDSDSSDDDDYSNIF